MKADFPGRPQGAGRVAGSGAVPPPDTELRRQIEAPWQTRDAVYDERLNEAIRLLLDRTPALGEPPADSSLRLKPERLSAHLIRMVQEADQRNHGKLPAEPLAKWCGIKPTTARGVLGRHPLVPRIQAQRAALELGASRADTPSVGIIKVFAGARNTTMRVRGVYRPRETAGDGRQLHLEFVVVTDRGRAVLVNTERFAVGDVTWDQMRAAGKQVAGDLRRAGIADPALLRQEWTRAVTRYHEEKWGKHATGRTPETVPEHIHALIGGAVDAAQRAGVPELYSGLPIVGGQLVAATSIGALPAEPELALVGHDLAAVEQLIQLGVLPVLDLNIADVGDGTALRALNELPFTVKVARREGPPAPLRAPELLALLSDPTRATPVPRDELDVRAPSKFAVSYVDGEVNFPSRSLPVRVYYRATPATPHNLYMVQLVPEDATTHKRALNAIVADSTTLHAGRSAVMANVRRICEQKGAFDPGGERAWPAESLAAIGHLAADRELHRTYGLQ